MYFLSVCVLFVAFFLIIDAEKCSKKFKYKTCADVRGGFSNVGGSCYATILVGGNFEQARLACRSLNPDADLATVRCESENQGLWQLAQVMLSPMCARFNPLVAYNQMWLGLRNEYSPLEPNTWALGSKATYRKWVSGKTRGTWDWSATMMMITNPDQEYPSTYWYDVPTPPKLCAAACEVIVSTSGKSCGQSVCRFSRANDRSSHHHERDGDSHRRRWDKDDHSDDSDDHWEDESRGRWPDSDDDESTSNEHRVSRFLDSFKKDSKGGDDSLKKNNGNEKKTNNKAKDSDDEIKIIIKNVIDAGGQGDPAKLTPLVVPIPK